MTLWRFTAFVFAANLIGWVLMLLLIGEAPAVPLWEAAAIVIGSSALFTERYYRWADRIDDAAIEMDTPPSFRKPTLALAGFWAFVLLLVLIVRVSG